MDLPTYWSNKLSQYSTEEWSNKPNIFATEILEYLPKTGKLLELGAGVCQDSTYFSSQGYKVIASDK